MDDMGTSRLPRGEASGVALLITHAPHVPLVHIQSASPISKPVRRYCTMTHPLCYAPRARPGCEAALCLWPVVPSTVAGTFVRAATFRVISPIVISPIVIPGSAQG